MKKALLFSAMLVVLVAALAQAVPDPWRIKVTDLDPNAPVSIAGGLQQRIWQTFPVPGQWGTTGGNLWIHYRDYAISSGLAVPASYTASTGAISFGAVTANSIDGIGYGNKGMSQIIKVGSTYKSWAGMWRNSYTGNDIQYTTSTDGLNWAAPTDCTTYGSTVQNTGSYGISGSYLSTGGVYLRIQGNSFAAYQDAHGHGINTSGDGETVWYDIDTKEPGNASAYFVGDPIHEPGDPTQNASNHHGRLSRNCAGSLVNARNMFTDYSGDPNHYGRGLGLIVGTGGELAGGDHYVWLSDPDNTNTQGIGDSLLSAIGLNGLSGPSLRTYMEVASWRGWYGFPVELKTAQTTPATQFAMFYFAGWDTDSSGGTKDVMGLGRAKLLLTRNKADLNYDGTVSASDIGPFSGAYGSTSGLNSTYNPDADMNASGKVDASDIGPFSGRYGSGCSYGE